MNIIRTRAVEITVVPAIAYKMKLKSGGAGIRIFRIDKDANASCTIDRRNGELVGYGTFNLEDFPLAAFDEAKELTEGLPYSARGNIKVIPQEIVEAEDIVVEEEIDKNDVISLPEYQALVERYSDENGKINYVLMNKDLIQFTSRSKIIGNMIQAKESVDSILIAIMKSRLQVIANQNNSLDDAMIVKLLEVFDEIDPRSAFKELKAHIIRLLSRVK